MNAAATLPQLPEPILARWQPLRMGIVDIYHYDREEFWFRDGHLLLRGNNGTGKSKVLSLTLPFLLDARLSSARVEPDGDRAKRMEWNLLMGGRYDRRQGYAWIEFGRRAEDGAARYLTLGCGLHAVAGRPRVEAWPFLTDQRIGRELFLINPQQTVIGRERLADAIAARGQVFDTATEYRRAVDERLFRLGEARYDALMDTLIQLRQPQLSKRPDEQNLSQALANALPPLPQAVLEDVAEAMTQLEDYRDQLARFEALQAAVVRFGQRYRAYAQVQARRQARGVRQAQTEFDTASRTLHQAQDDLAAAVEGARSQTERCAALDGQLRRDRAALDELRADPVMRDARRLHEAGEMAEERARDALEAEQRRLAAQDRLAQEQAATLYRRGQAEETSATLRRRITETRDLAGELGVEAEHRRLCEPLLQAVELDLETLRRELRELAQRRGEQIALVQRRLREQAQMAHARDIARSARNERAEDFELAQQTARDRDARLKQAAADLLKRWRDYFASLRVVSVGDADGAVELLAAWVETQDGGNPAQRALAAATHAAQRELVARQAALDQQRGRIESETRELETERARLAAGEDRIPPVAHTRDSEARAGRPGAPLWQLVDFGTGADAAQRAGVEAALEAAGLLDAWVTPEGVLIDPATRDVLLEPRARREDSLAAWLLPAASAAVSAERIGALLASVACSGEEDAQAEAWVAPDGRFRLGPARGAWTKPAAEFIGYAAREAARQRRLEEIALRLLELAAEHARLEQELGQLEIRQAEIEAALRQAPSDEPLVRAYIEFATAEKQRRLAQTRLAEADARLQQAEHAWARAADALAFDAQDLRLPAAAEPLAALERRLGDYREAAQGLLHAAHDHRRAQRELAEQAGREQAAHVQAEAQTAEAQRRRYAADEALAKRDVLRATVGAAVAELEARLRDTAARARQVEQDLEVVRRELSAAEQQRAKAEQKVEDAAQLLAERTARRLEWVSHLHAFARTGLLAIAAPEVALPETDADWTVDPALNVARRIEQTLAQVSAEEADWTRVQAEVSRDYTALTQALGAQGQQALAETTDYGLLVQIVYANRAERPDVLERRLQAEIAERRQVLTAREREVLENHLEREVAAYLQRLLQEAQRRVRHINAELERRPTSTGVRFRLDWQVLPESAEGAPVGLVAARGRLLNRAADAWSEEDRRVVGEFLQNGIAAERARSGEAGGTLLEHLSRSLDYRRWHRFRVQRFQDGAWRPLSGPASSGERALGLTVPLFAAASSHYASCGSPHAPRLVLLDEAFAGIDDEARAHCMALIREFDLDFVMTSEREWGCYAELPGVSICHLVRREGVDAVYVSRWSWDGRVRREVPDPSLRIPLAAPAEA